jgi:glutamine phosphoribosylpyrophosphate amidotransferase
VPKKRREICDILLNGLSRLEYRGYDSAGIAIDGDFNDKGLLETRLVKSKGKVRFCSTASCLMDTVGISVVLYSTGSHMFSLLCPLDRISAVFEIRSSLSSLPGKLCRVWVGC